jgi:hypothetical protein
MHLEEDQQKSPHQTFPIEPFTSLAVMGTRRFVSFASKAPSLATTVCVTFLLFGLRSLFGLGKSTGIYKAGSIIAYPDAQGEDIDFPSFVPCEWHRFEVQKEVL